MKSASLYVAVAILMTAGLRSMAQTANSPNRITDRSTFPVVFGPAGTMISAKPHAPFSTVLVERTEQMLNDGTNIAHDREEVIMRDGRGRVYRAQKFNRSLRAEQEPFLMFITIIDPVRDVQYRCFPIRKTCSKSEYRGPHFARRPGLPNAGDDPDVTIEDLGPSNISGVIVEGRRITRMVPEGKAGNDRPFSTVEELWHSKDLDVDVQVKRSDPRYGTRTTTMTEVNLSEPDPKYFQIPDGYTVEARPMPGTPFSTFPLPMRPRSNSKDPTTNQQTAP